MMYKYKRDERKQFQSVGAYFSVSCCFKQKTRVLLIKFFFSKEFASLTNNNREQHNTNTHREQSLFVVITYILRAKAIKINHV